MQTKAAKPASAIAAEAISSPMPALRPKESFQDLILALQQFWGEQGCVILQPYDMEVGAGTFHPATTLRALGPKPWNAAYVQPSRRPKDGRYGENPNRLQHYYQFQVIMKPSDRKSTRLNSSHANISYAVFCLKKKNSATSSSFFTPQPST